MIAMRIIALFHFSFVLFCYASIGNYAELKAYILKWKFDEYDWKNTMKLAGLMEHYACLCTEAEVTGSTGIT